MTFRRALEQGFHLIEGSGVAELALPIQIVMILTVTTGDDGTLREGLAKRRGASFLL